MIVDIALECQFLDACRVGSCTHIVNPFEGAGAITGDSKFEVNCSKLCVEREIHYTRARLGKRACRRSKRYRTSWIYGLMDMEVLER